jgi:2-oxoglutarate dehydrogenase E1 component
VTKLAGGPSWKKPNWPVRDSGELVSALTGEWAEAAKAVGDKVKASAQTRGVELSAEQVQQGDARFHPRADADPRLPHPRPLPRQARSARLEPEEARRSSIRAPTASAKPTRPADLPRQGARARIRDVREIVAILRRTYCQTLGVEFMHISNAAQKSWLQERIEGKDKEITFTREASARSSTS